MDRLLLFIEENIVEYIVPILTLHASIGEILVNIIVIIVTSALSTVENLYTGLFIVSEDFGIFLSELLENLNNFVDGFDYLVGCGFSRLWNNILDVAETVLVTSNFCLNILFQGVNIMQSLIFLAISSVRFLGASVNDAICLLSQPCVFLINLLLSPLWLVPSLKFNFVMPKNSIIEFLIGSGILLYAYCNIRFIFRIFYVVTCLFVSYAKTTFLNLWTGQTFARARRRERFANQNLENERILENPCVICLEKPKTVIYMPCRHFCTCLSCHERLPSALCPLCRKRIKNSIHVFT